MGGHGIAVYAPAGMVVTDQEMSQRSDAPGRLSPEKRIPFADFDIASAIPFIST
jgi:hypothetical protein